MESRLTREMREELGVERFNSLAALTTIADDLDGLAGLVWGMVEVSRQAEVTPESLAIIREKMVELADMARESAEVILGERSPGA